MFLVLFTNKVFRWRRGRDGIHRFHLFGRKRKGGNTMDPISAAIVAALAAGALSGLTETGKTAITDAYQELKDLLVKKFGARSQVVQTVDHLEARPESASLL